MLSIEEFMKPRYKVIANYPGSVYKIGDVIEYPINEPLTQEGWCVLMFSPYPAIFRPLAWYEERDVKDMPELVKNKIGVIFKIQVHKEIDINSKVYMTDKSPDGLRHLIDLKNCQPSTETEYLTYINTHPLK